MFFQNEEQAVKERSISVSTGENRPTGREHEVGVLAGPLLTFDLQKEIQQLRSEGRWQSGHTAKTLAKYADFRVVLIVMTSGGRLVNHRTEGRISVHALSGRSNFKTAEQSVDLSAGQMLTLERDLPHDVEAGVDSAFLLTIAWPGAQTASSNP
jgi:quercetin dioxygenase-like cupin family protein